MTADGAVARGILEFLADAALRGAGLVVVAAVALRLFRITSPVTQLRVWRLVLALLFMVPPLAAVAPWPLRVPIPGAPVVEVVPSRTPLTRVHVSQAPPIGLPPRVTVPPTPVKTLARSRSTLAVIFLTIYTAGALFYVSQIFVGWRTARRLRRAATPVGAGDGSIPVLESTLVRVPMTVGISRPVILLPMDWRQWPAATLESALAHESAHIGRGDPATLLIATVHRAAFWFSPVAWWVRSRLARLAERASDAAVIARGADPTTYARTIVAFAERVERNRRASWHLAMTGSSDLERRVEHILTWKGDKAMAVSGKGFTVLATSIATVATAIASIEAQPLAVRTIVERPSPLTRQVETVVMPSADPTFFFSTTRPHATRAATPPQHAAAPTQGAPVTFSGRWVPVDPPRADRFFEVGLSDVSGLGMQVTQDASTLTVMRLLSPEAENALPLRNIPRRSVYNLDGRPARGNNGDVTSTVSWDGEALVIDTSLPNGTTHAVWTMAGSQLRVDTTISVNSGVSNSVVLLYRRQDSHARAMRVIHFPAATRDDQTAVVCGLTLRYIAPELDGRIRRHASNTAGASMRLVVPETCAAAR